MFYDLNMPNLLLQILVQNLFIRLYVIILSQVMGIWMDFEHGYELGFLFKYG